MRSLLKNSSIRILIARTFSGDSWNQIDLLPSFNSTNTRCTQRTFFLPRVLHQVSNIWNSVVRILPLSFGSLCNPTNLIDWTVKKRTYLLSPQNFTVGLFLSSSPLFSFLSVARSHLRVRSNVFLNSQAFITIRVPLASDLDASLPSLFYLTRKTVFGPLRIHFSGIWDSSIAQCKESTPASKSCSSDIFLTFPNASFF